MRVLLLGATGFIGSEIAAALLHRGHQVSGLARDPAFGARILPAVEWIGGDLRAFQTAVAWRSLLGDVDVVVNASGALQTGLRDDVAAVQSGAIRALVAACRDADIGHFVQISASNADSGAASDFMASKGEADAFLAASGLSCTILRPGLVIGRNAFGGTELLRMAASLPGVLPEIAGTGAVQCVALADVVHAVIGAVEAPASARGCFDLVESSGRGLGEVIRLHRAWLGFAPARRRIMVPAWLLHLVSRLADGSGWLGWRSPLRSNAVAALAAGVSGNAAQASIVLGRQALTLEETLAALPRAGKADRWQARCALVQPLALGCLFLLWAGSGVLGFARLPEATAHLVDGGIPWGLASGLVVAASLGDLAVALLVSFRQTARVALLGMLALSLAYVAGALALLPGLWLDPLGPMLKVLPIIALTLLCLAMVDER